MTGQVQVSKYINSLSSFGGSLEIFSLNIWLRLRKDLAFLRTVYSLPLVNPSSTWGEHARKHLALGKWQHFEQLRLQQIHIGTSSNDKIKTQHDTISNSWWVLWYKLG